MVIASSSYTVCIASKLQGIGRRDDLRIPRPGPAALIGRGFNHATTAQNGRGKNRYDDPRFQRPAGHGRGAPSHRLSW
jgi:hypothetical protein